MIEQDRIRAYLRLTLADGVGAITFWRLVEAFGDVAKVPVHSPPQLVRAQGVGDVTAGAIADVTDEQVDAELAAAAKLSARILCAEEDDYPASLKQLPGRPAVLYIRGDLKPTDALALAVVGSRHCTHYGMEQAERFGQLLARAGLTIVSGGARGIDTAAHRGALACGGRTIAVMGCGLCHTYPRENADLFEQIIRDGRGALVSELPMRTAVLAGNFPTRNRIISGLSLGVLVVEAARRSGSLITAREANEQGKSIFALPGRVDYPQSQGTNELIRKGEAFLVQDLDDVLGQLGDVGRTLAGESGAAPGTGSGRDATPGGDGAGGLFDSAPAGDILPPNLDPCEMKLLELLGKGSMSVDELTRTSSLPTARVTASLTMLVLKGHIAQQAGNVFARKVRGSGR